MIKVRSVSWGKRQTRQTWWNGTLWIADPFDPRSFQAPDSAEPGHLKGPDLAGTYLRIVFGLATYSHSQGTS